MRRRTVFLVAVLALVLLAAAIAPWTLTGGGVAANVAGYLREGYGLDLQVRGRTTLAVLPVPRVKFEDVRLSSADGAVAIEGGTIRGELRLLPLLVGRVELSDVALSGSRVTLSGDWTRWLAAASLPRPELMLRRLVLTGSSLRWPAGSLDDMNLVVSWAAGPRIDMAGSLSWQRERVELTRATVHPASLNAGHPSAFALALAAPSSRISVSGEVVMGSDPQVTGTSRIEIRSAGDFARWSGIELPLASVVPSVVVQGEFSADRHRLSWPSVVVTLGTDRLDGTLGLRFHDGRPGLTGTLAADRLNLSDVLAPLLHARTAGGWNGDAVSLDPVTGGDLDLRLSAAEATVGRLTLDDMAASILVRPGRVEASMSRAGLSEGTLKGRLTLSHDGGTVDVRAHGGFDRVDLGRLLPSVGSPRWIAGQASGQFTLDGSGSTISDIVRQTSGRATMTVRRGELVGVGLNDVVKRVEKRPLAASMEWRGGRTPFEVAHVNLLVRGGIGEITEGSLLAPSLRTTLHGHVSLFDGAVALRADVDPTPSPSTSPLIVFDVTGGFGDIAIVPEAKPLIERSGAAKPLFGERVAPAPQHPSAPMATAE